MLKKVFAAVFLSVFIFGSASFAKELNLTKGKVYLLNFDEEILSFNTEEKVLDVQLLHTIFSDKTKLVLMLKENKKSFLQVKTENDFYNYEIKNSAKPSKELTEIDIPPVENLDVDIYTGRD